MGYTDNIYRCEDFWKMNILLINTHFHGGGAEKVTRQIYYGLKSRELPVHLLVGRESKTDGTYEIIYDNPLRSRILRATTRFIRNVRPHVPLAVKKILAAIEKYDIDIIHFNNIHGNYIGIEDIKEISRHCPVVWTLHDMWPLTGHCAHAFDCRLWIDGNCKPCSNLSMFPELRYDNASRLYNLKKSSFSGQNIHFVTPSLWLKERCESSFLRDEDIRVINNGVDTNLYICQDKAALRRKYNVPENKTAILFGAAYLNSPFKGMRYLIDALNALADKEKYVLLVIGSNMDRELFSPDFHMIPFGYISDERKLAEIYSMADVFVMSSMAENFPCSSIESFACGTPVIAFATGGLTEQIDEQTGILVERGNTTALTKAIMDFAALSPKQRDLMGQACRKKAESLYSEESMIEQYVSLYKTILEGDVKS